MKKIESDSTLLTSSSQTSDLEKRLALLTINTEEPFILIGTDLNIITYNEKFEKLYLTHFKKHIIKGRCILDYSQKNSIEDLRKLYQSVFSGEIQHSEFEITNPGAEPHTLKIKYKPAYDENKNIVGAFVSATDVTTIKKSQQQLSQSEKRFRALVENGQDALAIIGLDGQLSYVSPSVKKLLGYTEAEMLKINVFSLLHPDDLELAKQKIETVLQSPGESLSIDKVRFFHKDGTWHWYESTLTNFSQDPLINGITSNFRDITEKVKSEQQKEFDHNNLSALINNTRDMMWSISVDGKLISSNAAFDEMVKRMSGSDVVKGGNAPTKGFSRENLQRWEQLYARAFSGESFTIVEYTELPEEHWSEISFYPIRNENDIVGTACYARNITERKLFEKQLESQTKNILIVKNELEYSELRLKQAQSIARVGSWEVDFASNSSIWSDEAYNIYGLEPGDHKLSFEEWRSFIHPEDLPGFEAEMKRHREALDESSFKHRIICKNGKIKHVISESRFEFDDSGKPVGLYGVVHDITARVRAEKKLVESHTLLKKLTDNLPLAVYQFEIDPLGNMSFPFMSTAIQLLVPNVDIDLIKKDVSPIFAAVHPEDLPSLITSIQESKNTLENWQLEFRILEGENLKWINGFSRPQKKEDGSVVWYGYLRDITEKRQITEEIRTAKERYDLIAKATNDALYDWDLTTEEVYRSGDGLKVLFGYEDKDVIAESDFWHKRVHPEDADLCYSKLKQTLADPTRSTCDQEYRFRKADGTYAYVFDKGIILRDSNGVAQRMIGATQDVTRLKESETLLKDLNEKLEKRAKELALSNAELEQFAYIASHDLQEPLRMVTSFLTQLENKYKEKLDDKAKQYIHFATDGAIRMRRLILDLLEYSRVGKQVNAKVMTDSNTLVSESIKFNKHLIEETKAIVTWKSLPIVYGCNSRLLQVFQNLIGNALKYQQPGARPEVTIIATESDSHWQFTVSDNGIGIEEKYFEKIFIVFQRLHNKDEYSGTGIGLAICKKIVEGHDGQIWVESILGEGTRFHFTLAKKQLTT
ncbi:MAG: PAS domain S-box protein [Bacteroidia bacterium]|nr:PAS domain S-box protein [Bacteroidia bacterium]